MTNEVRLRAVEDGDLPVFFAHQLDPEAVRMAAFPSRDREAFMAHCRSRESGRQSDRGQSGSTNGCLCASR